MKKNLISLLISATGIIIVIMLLTLSFSLYEGGTIKAVPYFMGKDKSVLSVGLKNKDDLALSKNMLNWEDGEKIQEKLSHVEKLIISSRGAGILSSDIKAIQIKAMGINQLYWNIDNKKILYGRLINEEDLILPKAVIIINEKASTDLFGTRDSVGKIVDLDMGSITKSFSVIGVLKDPCYYKDSDCYFPYIFFSPDSYEKNWISIVVPKVLKEDNKDKLSKILYDIYGTDIYEARDYNQLIFVQDWLNKNVKALMLLIIMSTIIGLLTFVYGLGNYFNEQRDRIYVLKAFGIKDDKIKIKLFNQLSLQGLLIILISIILGYLIALIIGSLMFIKPVLSIKYISIIMSFGYLSIVLAVLVSFKRLKIHDIL